MRILVADNHEDGMYKCREELLEELTKISEVHISIPKGKYTQQMIDLGCCFHDLQIARRGMNPFQETKLILEYMRLLKKVQPDIVLTFSIKPNVYLGFLCGKKGIPYIANVTGLGSSIQGGGITAKIMLFLYRIGLKKAQMVFCQNKNNCIFLIKHKVIFGDYEIIPGSGVNLEKHCFEEYPRKKEELRFLTIGRIMKDKGTSELLEAAESIKKKYKNVSFSMIGFYDGDYEKDIRKAEEAGVIKFYGHQDDVHSFIKESHAIIHPSYHEGMANALLESAASGRPVIATNIPGCIEAFDPGETGIECEPHNSKSLENAIIRFIEIPYEIKKEMGVAARKKMEKEFDRKIVIREYKKIIEKIMQNKDPVKLSQDFKTS